MIIFVTQICIYVRHVCIFVGQICSFREQICMYVCGTDMHVCLWDSYICLQGRYVYLWDSFHFSFVTRGLMKEGTFRTRKAFYLQKFFRRQILLVLLRFNSKGDQLQVIYVVFYSYKRVRRYDIITIWKTYYHFGKFIY